MHGDAAAARGVLPLNAADEIAECILTGQLPCTAEIAGQPIPISVRFELDLHHHPDPPPGQQRNLRLITTINDTGHTVVDDWFEDGMLRLDHAIRPITCGAA